MADTPDLARIVNMIMENPSLVAEISAMAKSASEGESTESKEPKAESPTPTASEVSATSKSANRARLLGAMKPYLSKERAQAIDTMIGIAEILEISRRRS